MKRQTLETAIAGFLPLDGITFDVHAFELWRDGDSWTVNDTWRIASGVDAQGVMEAARGRWEVFKVNYAPRARVRDLNDIGYEPDRISLECNHLSFLEIVATEFTPENQLPNVTR